MQDLDFYNLQEARRELLEHPIYKTINSPARVRIFMEHHVFAVWDFMSLLKRLQRETTSLAVPWSPSPRPTATRFINEIVLGEESDEDGRGGYASHFQLYLDAMRQVGADTRPIDRFLDELHHGKRYEEALADEAIPRSAADFVYFTLELAVKGKTHEVAAAFFYGREDLIPEMFASFVDSLRREKLNADRLTYYLERHVELDKDHHGPLAQQLLEELCGGDSAKIDEAKRMATRSLEARKRLWNGVLEEIERRRLA